MTSGRISIRRWLRTHPRLRDITFYGSATAIGLVVFMWIVNLRSSPIGGRWFHRGLKLCYKLTPAQGFDPRSAVFGYFGPYDPMDDVLGFAWVTDAYGHHLAVPYWFLTAVAIAATLAGWNKQGTRKAARYGTPTLGIFLVAMWVCHGSGQAFGARWSSSGLSLRLNIKQPPRDPDVSIRHAWHLTMKPPVQRSFLGVAYSKSPWTREVLIPWAWLFLPLLATCLVAWRFKPVRPNHCVDCDYNLTGNESGVCPECGKRIRHLIVG